MSRLRSVRRRCIGSMLRIGMITAPTSWRRRKRAERSRGRWCATEALTPREGGLAHQTSFAEATAGFFAVYRARDRRLTMRALIPDPKSKNDAGSGTGAGPPDEALNRYWALLNDHSVGCSTPFGPAARVIVILPDPLRVFARPPGKNGGASVPDAVKGAVKVRSWPMATGLGKDIGAPWTSRFKSPSVSSSPGPTR